MLGVLGVVGVILILLLLPQFTGLVASDFIGTALEPDPLHLRYCSFGLTSFIIGHSKQVSIYFLLLSQLILPIPVVLQMPPAFFKLLSNSVKLHCLSVIIPL